MSEVYTIPEVAKILRIGRSAAYEAARRGEIPTIRVGRSLRVPRVAIERMLSCDEGTSEWMTPQGAYDTSKRQPKE